MRRAFVAKSTWPASWRKRRRSWTPRSRRTSDPPAPLPPGRHAPARNLVAIANPDFASYCRGHGVRARRRCQATRAWLFGAVWRLRGDTFWTAEVAVIGRRGRGGGRDGRPRAIGKGAGTDRGRGPSNQAHRHPDARESIVRSHARPADARHSRPPGGTPRRLLESGQERWTLRRHRRRGVPGAVPHRSAPRVRGCEVPGVRCGRSSTRRADHGWLCPELRARGRQPRQRHALLPARAAPGPDGAREALSRVRQLVRVRARVDPAQPSIRAFRDVVRPGRLHAHLARAREGNLRPPGGRREKGDGLLLQRPERVLCDEVSGLQVLWSLWGLSHR